MKNLMMICALVLGSQVANAGLVLEPYLGYQMGKMDATYTAALGGGTESAKDKGPVVGARVGYSFVIPWVALDYSMYSGTTDSDPSEDLKQNNLGLTVGAQMIPLVRPYAGYIFSAENTVSSSGNTDVTFKGTGIKVGLGLKILPLLNINVEYATIDYKDIDGVPGFTSVSDVYSDMKYTTTTIGLSYVF